MSSADAIVSFDQVSVRYDNGPTIFRDVSFDLAPGSFHFLTGASGAGKSSLIKLLFLEHFDFQGSVKILGRHVRDIDTSMISQLRRQIGVVFQDFYLLDHLTALENVALPLRVRGESWRQCCTRAEEILQWVGLEKAKDARPDVLSGGEKQRVAFARAVIAQPKLLLADEPTGSVDDEMAVKLLRLFEELNKQGTTVVLATHNRDLVTEFAYPELNLSEQTLWYHPSDCAETVAAEPIMEEGRRLCA